MTIIAAANSFLGNFPAVEFFTFALTVAGFVTVIVNVVNSQNRDKGELEKGIASCNTKIERLEFKIKTLAATAKYKQNENANRILDLEGFLETNSNYHRRQINSDSGADFLDNLE